MCVMGKSVAYFNMFAVCVLMPVDFLSGVMIMCYGKAGC